MGYKTLAVAPPGRAEKALTITQGGVFDLRFKVKDNVNVAVSFMRGTSVVKTTNDTAVSSEVVHSGDTLANIPVAPGSVTVSSSGSVPTLKDSGKDGVLKVDRTATPGQVIITKTNGATSVPATRTLTSAATNFTTSGVLVGDQLVLNDSQDKGVYTIVTVGTTTVVVDRDFPVGSLTTISFSVIAQEITAGRVNYLTGEIVLSYPSSPAAATPGGHGTVVGTVAFPINLSPGAVLAVDIDGGGASNATFDAAAATLDGSGGTFATMSSESFEVRFKENGVWGEWQLVTFGTEGTQQAAVDLINSVIAGGYAVINGVNVDIVSDAKGTGASVATQNVDSGVTTKLGIANDDSDVGTGDVSDINSVTFAEAKAVIEADVSDSSVTLEGGSYIRITSSSAEVGASSTVQVSASATATAFGLDTSEHAGDDAGAQTGVLASYTQVSQLTGLKFDSMRVTNPPNTELDVYLTAAGVVGTMVDVEVVGP